MRDPSIVHTADGDPEYLAGALDGAERGMPLRPVDVQELGYRIGLDQARKVARDVAAYARDRQRWSGIHQTRDLPFPPALARLFGRLRSGQPVGPDDVRRLVGRGMRRLGRRQARRIERTLRRLPTTKRRAAGRHTYPRRGRR